MLAFMEIRVPLGTRIVMRALSPQRVDRGNTVTAGGSGRVQTTEELLQFERRRVLVLEERLAVLEKQVHTSSVTISNNTDTIRALEARSQGAESLASGLQARLMKLADYVRQQKDKGNAHSEIEGLLTAQANNAENRVMTLQEELTLEKENASLLLEEIAVAKAQAQDLNARVLDYEVKIRDLEIRSMNSSHSDVRVKAAEERAAQQEATQKATEQKLLKLVELVKQDKEREKEKDNVRTIEREKDRLQLQQLQAQIASLLSNSSVQTLLPAPSIPPPSVPSPPGSPGSGSGRSSGNTREAELVEKLKAAEARITKMTEVMRAADTKVRNSEMWEQKLKETESAKAALEARIKSLEEQPEEAKRVASYQAAAQTTDVSALLTKVARHEQKIRLLVDTVKTERASFQRQLAEAKFAAGTSGVPGSVLAVKQNGSGRRPSAEVEPTVPPSPPPPPPPGGIKLKGPSRAAGGDLSAALSGVKLRSTQNGANSPDPASPSPEPGRRPQVKLPQLGTPAGNLGSIAEQALARRANLKPAPLSPRGPLSAPPPPPAEP